MKLMVDKEDLSEVIKRADLPAKRKAFRNGMPYAILREGQIILVFPDKHIEIVNPDHLDEMHFTAK